MIFNLRKRELRIELKEKEISKVRDELHSRIEKDRVGVKKINEILANGITLKISQAAGHK